MCAILTALRFHAKLPNRRLIVRGCSSMKQWQDALLHYHQTKNAALLLDSTILPPTFKACANLQSLKQGISIHADVIKLGFKSYTSTGNSIVSFYSKCGMMESALSLFDGMARKDCVSWNAVIHGFLTQGDYEFGLGLFMEARVSDFVPNVATLVLVVQACWRLEATNEGWNLHGFIIRSGFSAVFSVQNSLLSMYGKSGDLVAAHKLFDEMGERDVISWSALISGYAQSGDSAGALRLFRSMSVEGGVDVDGHAVVSVLQACSNMEDPSNGRLVHGQIIRRGFEDDVFVGNSLVDMYSKCSDVDSAVLAFNAMPEANIVSWNSMLSGLLHNEKYVEAFVLFETMRKAGIGGDEVTVVNLLQVCKKVGPVVWCKCIHSMAIRRQFGRNGYIMNTLLDAYTKCGLLDLALKLFESIERKDMISWSTMIAGFAHCGKPDLAIAFFHEMRRAEEIPNSITMLSLLDACSVSAELKLAKCGHGVVTRYCLANEISIGTALIDMYSKCGDLNASRKLFDQMPERNILSWNAMIGGLGMNGRAREAISVLREMELGKLKPNGVTMLSILSACSHGGLVEEGLSCFERMMKDPSLQPSLEHYSCIVDMLGRAGDVEGARELIKRMPEGVEAGPAAWGALLSACGRYGKWELGQEAASRVLELEPTSSAGYLLSSSMFGEGGSAGRMAKMRWLMREKGVRVVSGYSLVHVDQRSHKFVAWDGSHPQSDGIYAMVEHLHYCMKVSEETHFPDIHLSDVKIK